jgi:hypothetical protein
MLLAFRIGADNVPPTITCPAPRTLSAGTNCTAAVDLRSNATATDNSAAPLTILQTPSATTQLGLGTHTVTLVAVDAAGNQSEPCTTTVTVVDRTAPSIIGVNPSQTQIWPPNQRMEPITVDVAVTDNCSSSISSEIISVTSNEPSDTPDWEITGPLSVSLRAERSESGLGRVYTITVRCTDEAGNSSTRVGTVLVPKNQKRKNQGEL